MEVLEEMKKHLEQLNIGYEKQIANIHAQEGAIQECEMWINKLKAGDEGCTPTNK
jgi:hypothetical protein